MNILDTLPEEMFDRITRIACAALDVPIAIVSLQDDDRYWFKSVQGFSVCETSVEESLCQYSMSAPGAFEIPDTALDPRLKGNLFVDGPERIRFYAGVPLNSVEGVRIGTLCVLDRTPRVITEAHRQILRDLAAVAAHELELRRIASTDALTGAWNRRMLEIVAANEFHRAERVKHPFSIAVLDIDHFKRVNDRFGHEAGNDALHGFASTFREVMRAEDWLFRIGGEEFAAILIGCDGNSATEAMDRFRREVANRDFAVSEGRFRMTASGAVIEAANAEGTALGPLAHLLELADKGLYQAKRLGRNRIVKVA
ncbi:sensor domain-containing diguanylate cyclase [Aquabacter cavernae]|uniref:sensor domain-containing diguanylate cyclase n=1 Tax=Aquabacter cavernae TaxID=2496029 RepID=UPI0013DEA8C4|nr:sensor domain-containing diguanylate cyclase [Aquabacter cavernae]